MICTRNKDMFKAKALCIYHCGDVSGEVPPVLIPNTEVKLTSAENTLLETARENRLLLHPLKQSIHRLMGAFILASNNLFPYGKKSGVDWFLYKQSALNLIVNKKKGFFYRHIANAMNACCCKK